MTMNPEQRAVVADAVAKQIDHLDTTAEAVARAADVSGNTVRRVLAARSWPQASVRKRLELALGWAAGSFERIALRGTHLSGLEGWSDLDVALEILRRTHERDRRAGL